MAGRIERDGLEAFVDRWQRMPLLATPDRPCRPSAGAALRAQRLRNRPLGLANSLRGMGAGAQDCLLSRLGELRVPTLLMAGALDERYAELAHDDGGPN